MSKLQARLADNVLEKEDWTVWELTIEGSKVVSTRAVEYEERGAYGEPAFKGMTVAQVSGWTHYDGAGVHPEGYKEIKINGQWEVFVSLEDLERELARGVVS